jgi:hypothetical protein
LAEQVKQNEALLKAMDAGERETKMRRDTEANQARVKFVEDMSRQLDDRRRILDEREQSINKEAGLQAKKELEVLLDAKDKELREKAERLEQKQRDIATAHELNSKTRKRLEDVDKALHGMCT